IELRCQIPLLAKLLRPTQKRWDELASRSKKSPKYDESMVQQYNQRIAAWLKPYRAAIRAGQVRVFAVDECHLNGGDSSGPTTADISAMFNPDCDWKPLS
ncbi:MAG: hypothetical protein AAF268_05645, partial [Cyanobacteria bacterium P01_A01_bin.3]